MAVSVDQTGSSREAVKIDDPRGRAGSPLDLGRGSHRDNLAFGDGDSFNDGVLRVDGQDLAVDQDQVRSLRRSRSRQGEKQAAKGCV